MSQGSRAVGAAGFDEGRLGSGEHGAVPVGGPDAPELPDGVKVDLAHVVMMAERGIVSPEQAGPLASALLELDGVDVDDYSSVERRLIERLGVDVAGRLQTGRSRIDRNATISRLSTRRATLKVLGSLCALRQVVLAVADAHVETVMPGYTHLQHAQPWTFGHYLSSYGDRLDRDAARLRDGYRRTNRCPLGAAALAGTSWPIDRERTSALLGFDGPVRNSKDAGEFCKDYDLELVSSLAILMITVGHLANELYLFCSYEFGLVELADEHAGTSSLMPQKKNPHALDMIKGMAGFVVGLPAVELSKHRMSTSSDLDATFGPSTVPHAAEMTASSLQMLAAVLGGLEVHRDVMRRRAAENWATVVHLADELTRQMGLSFRESHQVCGRMVRLAAERGLHPVDATGALLDEAAEQILDRRLGLDSAFVQRCLDPDEFVRSRVTAGSVSPREVRAMLGEQRQRLGEDQEWIAAAQGRIAAADRSLEEAIEALPLPDDDASNGATDGPPE